MNFDNQGKYDVYMSGALTGLSPDQMMYATREIYERVFDCCSSLGLKCYLPHKSETTPNKGTTHSKVWKTDKTKIIQCSVMVAYLGIPSFGVGSEIEMAHEGDVPIVLLCEKSRQESLSRLVLGNPAVVDIFLFDDPQEFESDLKRQLIAIFSEKNFRIAADDLNLRHSDEMKLKEPLDHLVNAVRSGANFRNFPSRPISVDDWKVRARVMMNTPGTDSSVDGLDRFI